MPEFEPQTDSNNPEAQELPLSTDFFHGGIKAGLERIRLRLLDLTNRNRLLNFRHAEKSSLRVINELPDELFYMCCCRLLLAAGKGQVRNVSVNIRGDTSEE